MNTQATKAVLIKNDTVIGTTDTTARSGATVSYGKHKLEDGGIVEIGRAKVSRAKKYLNNDELMYNLQYSHYVVNHSDYGDA